MRETVTYRPKANLIWAGIALALDAMFLAQAIWYPARGENLAFDAVFFAVIATGSYLVLVKPKVVFESDHLRVVNPFRVVTIAYGDITGLDTKWSLQVHHSQRSTRVWVAPASGKYRWISDSTLRWSFSRMPRAEARLGEIVPASETLNSDSGVVAQMIRQRMAGMH